MWWMQSSSVVHGDDGLWLNVELIDPVQSTTTTTIVAHTPRPVAVVRVVHVVVVVVVALEEGVVV